MAILRFSIHDRVLFETKVTSSRVVLGRSDTCDVALPGEGLSRQHCRIESRGPKWMLIDMSKHGTFIEGKRIQRAPLVDGSQFEMGGYLVSFHEELATSVPDTVAIIAPKYHEFIVACEEDVIFEHAVLTVTDGPAKGYRVHLEQMETSLGGEGSGIVLTDDTLVSQHCVVTVSRGRPMITPCNGPVYMDGHRLIGTTPIYAEDVLRIGQTDFALHIQKTTQKTEAAMTFGAMIGRSKCMQHVFGQLRRFSSHDFPVLIFGESGTGKELAARGLHDHSQRANGPFVAINCGAIPENLLESELFGYEKGAFSGAVGRKDGAFQQASRGTLFLDELGELPLAAQAKLLRVLESGEVRRVGGIAAEFPDVRIVTATNRNLHAMVKEGTFRGDLLFRLQVLSVTMPPLRDRREDLFPIAEKICEQLGPTCVLEDSARRVLWGHVWSGNVRELRNVLSRAFVMSGGSIAANHIEIFDTVNPVSVSHVILEDREFLLQVLANCRGNRSKAARELGIPRSTLMYKLNQLKEESGERRGG